MKIAVKNVRNRLCFKQTNEFFSLVEESRWSHQKDLDDFFVRVYQYHQRHGFFCILLSEIFSLV